MNGAELLETPQWSLESIIGYSHSLLKINSETVIHTWIIIAILAVLLMIIHYLLAYTKMGRFVVLYFIGFFIDLTKQSIGTFVYSHFAFATSLFIFILLCNIAPIIPWLDEPTKDLNTTLALGIISFLYIQGVSIKTHGIGPYVKNFFKPIFIWLPLNIIGKLSSVISISFRLFGNIFGGAIISKIFFGAISGSIFWELLGLFPGIAITCFFTLFEGFLQAFVFAILTLTYLAIGMQKDAH